MRAPKFINKKKSDDYFLEVIAMIVFCIGFNFALVQKKWPEIYNAFGKFSVKKVGSYSEADFEKLVSNEKIIRNRRKIRAIINNALVLQRISHEHGSVQKWVNRICRDYEKSPVLSEHPIDAVKREFELLGPMTSKWFLWSAGKKIDG